MTLLPTQINGLYTDHSSVRVTFPNSELFFSHVKSINYEQSLTPAEAYGTHPIPLPTGLGQSKASATIVVVKEAWNDFIAHAGPGYGAAVFSIPITYVPRGSYDAIEDILHDCRITGVKQSSAQGQGGLEVELSLYVRYITQNGISLVPIDNDMIPNQLAA